VLFVGEFSLKRILRFDLTLESIGSVDWVRQTTNPPLLTLSPGFHFVDWREEVNHATVKDLLIF